jgi:hypothetical protein
MRRYLPYVGVVWGAAIVVYAVAKGGSFLALLFGVAMVLAGGHELTKTRRRSRENA